MNPITQPTKVLFVINERSGQGIRDVGKEIERFFSHKPQIDAIRIKLRFPVHAPSLYEEILEKGPDVVVAVGGDGTINLLAGLLLGKGLPMGIVPFGSANGMCKDLHIPNNVQAALSLLLKDERRAIHVTLVNGKPCVHLSDIGINAYIIKKFDQIGHRGKWAYAKAAWKAFWSHDKLKVALKLHNAIIKREASMVVIANGNTYGTGMKINPIGNLTDDTFEVVIVRRISLMELLKMTFTRLPLNPQKTELFQVSSMDLRSKKKVHFQIDGEYQGKVNDIEAHLAPQGLEIICGLGNQST